MKKKILGVLLFIVSLVLPFAVHAAAEINLDSYEQMNLIDTLESEGMEIENKDYEETKNQLTIYMFRGQGCHFCQDFLTYLNSLTKDYGNLFKLRSFEVWNDTTNAGLLKKMGDVTGTSASGVPFIIIGEQVFAGYTEEWNSDILNAIQTEAAKKEKFDYFEEYNKAQKAAAKGNGVDTFKIIVAVIIVNAITVLFVYLIEDKNKKDIMRHMTKIYRRLSASNETQTTEFPIAEATETNEDSELTSTDEVETDVQTSKPVEEETEDDLDYKEKEPKKKKKHR